MGECTVCLLTCFALWFSVRVYSLIGFYTETMNAQTCLQVFMHKCINLQVVFAVSRDECIVHELAPTDPN